MTVFADSSALMKFYADEDSADLVRTIQAPVVSVLARAEVPAAMWGKVRTGALTDSDAAVLVAEFIADWTGDTTSTPRFAAVPATAHLLADAGRLTGVNLLRAYDAVQLASASATREALGDLTLAAFDRRLRAAAAHEGFALLPAGDPP